MNSDWVVAYSGDLSEFPKNIWKIEIIWMNWKYIALEDTV